MKLSPLGTAVVAAVGALAVKNHAQDAASSLMASISVSPVSGAIPGMPTDVAHAKKAILAGNYTSQQHHQGRDRCPAKCSQVGIDTGAWFVYGSVDRLDRACSKALLLDFALFNPINHRESHVAISACTADYASIPGSESGSRATATCAAPDTPQTQTTSPLQLASSGASSSAHVADVVTAIEQLQGFVAASDVSCNETIKYAYAGGVAVGVYAGTGLAGQGVLNGALEKFRTQIEDEGSVAQDMSIEMCSDDSSARYSLRILASTHGDLGAIQAGLLASKNGTCEQSQSNATSWATATYLVPDSSASSGTTSRRAASTRDAACSTIQVESGDTCEALAGECGITPAQFTDYNPSSTLCSSLTPGQHVCCSAGTLPDFSPQPGADGYCYAYLVQTGDSCSAIAAAHDLTNQDIEDFNTETWGWNGCEKLFADYNICLSTGYPPMPASIPNAVCGPQVVNTAQAPPGTDLSLLNQCPLNACCNIWGQCGTTAEFCTASESATGAPGTAAPGENGCISNCGTDILTSAYPSETYRIAYFEAFDWQRSCLRMAVNNIDTSRYTHIHYSFITLNADFSVNMDDVADQLQLLRAMVGIKKIVSVGGWTFSTDPSSYQIFRNAVATQANRNAVVTNIINFLNQYNLDGVDWDWEYPSEPDIPGIPAGSELESVGFFLLLNQLKNDMPAGKTVSVTAPASFWYLQYFPIQALSLVVDYLVYMTYDLHGQWDYGNKWATPGCGSFDQGLGNCLRSHVNLTESINALSMITKAGVPSNMIVVGVSSYGRSFQMSSPGCWTEQCTFTGPDSGAYPGRCTGTAGYISDFEIGEILAQNPSAQELWDQDSFSNIVVFNGTQWVAHMDADNKATREQLYPGLTFLGTADWAVDLQSENGDKVAVGIDSSDGIIYVDPDIWNSAGPVVTAPPGALLVWPPKQLPAPTTISFPLWTTTISYSSLTTMTSTLADGSISTYPWYIYESWLTVLTIPPVTTTAIAVWGVSLTTSTPDVPVPIVLTRSIQPPPFTIIVTPVISGTTSIIGATETTTITPEPVIWGTSTYYPSTETRTLGGTTSIIGGQTKPPTTMTITPNPHPTTTPAPGSTDPVINSNTPSWSPGKPPAPTAPPGCPLCGILCLLFCNPRCPTCPPGIFSPQESGGNENNDDDEDDPENEGAEYTIVFDAMGDDPFPTALLSLPELLALDADVMDMVSSEWGITSTTTTTTTTTTTATTEPPAPTPHVDCIFWDSILWYTFEVYNIWGGWVTDGGQKLHDEEDGCGALTGWEWHPATPDTYAYAIFHLDFFIKSGCVERAIASAGGPQISCRGQGVGPTHKKRGGGGGGDDPTDNDDDEDDDDRVLSLSELVNRMLHAREPTKTLTTPTYPSYTEEELQRLESFYRAVYAQSEEEPETSSYVPMTWSSVDPTPTPTVPARARV